MCTSAMLTTTARALVTEPVTDARGRMIGRSISAEERMAAMRWGEGHWHDDNAGIPTGEANDGKAV